jgi:hypothetical protein
MVTVCALVPCTVFAEFTLFPPPLLRGRLKTVKFIFTVHIYFFYRLHISNVEIHAISCALGLSTCVLFPAQRTVCARSTLSPRPQPMGRIETAMPQLTKLLTPCLELLSSVWFLGQRSLESIGESNLGILGPPSLGVVS